MFGSLNEGGIIETDRYDRRTYGRVLEESARLQEAVSDQSVNGLTEDVWASLYKAAPTFKQNGSSVNRRVMQTLMNQSAWQDLRQTTQMDEYSSALGSLSLKDTINQAIPDEVREQAKNLQDMEQKLQQLLAQAAAFNEASQNLEGDAAQNAQAKADGYQQQANGLAEQLEQAENQFNQSFDANSGSIARAFRQALEQANDQAHEERHAAQTFGIDPGDGNPVNGKARLELAEHLHTNPYLAEIAKMAGRMQMIALNKRRNRTKHPPTEIVNVTIGDELANVLPSELLLLADPATEDEFIQRFAEKRLMQYDLRGYEREGQGPIIVCIDESASTQGTTEAWEKGISLSLYAIARREKRAYAVIHFGSADEIKVEKWNKAKEVTPSELVNMAEHFFNGGTDFESPLREAVKVMDESDFKKGDIVFLTDGAASVSDSFLHGEFARVKKEKAFNVISVVIGYRDSAVRPFSDVIAKPQMGDDHTLNFVIENLN